MGHQLLLTSSIAHDKYTQTVSTLQALTGLRSPQPVATYTILTRPHNVFKPKFEPGKVNQIEQYYMKCTTTWNDDAVRELDLAQPVLADSSKINVDRLFSGKEVKHWTLQISDIPTAGKNQVSAQNIHESTVVHHHCRSRKEQAPKAAGSGENGPPGGSSGTDGPDVEVLDDGAPPPADESEKDSFLQFLEDIGYDVLNQYWLKGIRFFYGDIVIEIFKIFVRHDGAASEEAKIRLKALDESNTFQIKAYITFPKNANVDAVSRGTKDMTNLKATLHNLFELDVPDRMCMDSRVARAH